METKNNQLYFVCDEVISTTPDDYIKFCYDNLFRLTEPLFHALNVGIDTKKVGATEYELTMRIRNDKPLCFKYLEEHIKSNKMYVRSFAISKILVENKRYFVRKIKNVNLNKYPDLDISRILYVAKHYMVVLAMYEVAGQCNLPDKETRLTSKLDQLGYRLGFDYNFITRHLIGLPIVINVVDNLDIHYPDYRFYIKNKNTALFYLEYRFSSYTDYFNEICNLPDNVDTSESVFKYVKEKQFKVKKLSIGNSLNLIPVIYNPNSDEAFVINGNFTYKQKSSFDLIPKVEVELSGKKAILNTTLDNFEKELFGTTLEEFNV